MYLGGDFLENIQPKEVTSAYLLPVKKDKPPADRWHSLICYIPIDAIVQYLKCSFWVKHWSVVYHDKDIYLDDVYSDDGSLKYSKGTPKEPHAHILLYAKDYKTSSAVVKRFNNLAYQYALDNGGLIQNTLGQLAYEPLIAYRYQLHLDDKDKFQYPKDCRIVDSELFWSDFEFSEQYENKALAIFDDIRAGLSTRELISKYGCTFAHNSTRYYNLVYDYEKALKLQELQFSIDNCCGLANNLDFVDLLSQYVSTDLVNSPFTQDQINNFWTILSYTDNLLKQDLLQFKIIKI